MRRAIAVTLLGAVGLVTVACDSFVDYTVVNETDQELQAWVLFADCREVVGKRGEYDYERTVPPRLTVEVFDVTGSLPDGPWCVQVVDSERRLVAAEPYPESAGSVRLAVREPIKPGRVIPPEKQLPGRSWWEQFSDEPGAYVFALTVYGVLFGGLVVAALVVLKFIRDRRRKRHLMGR